MGRYCSYTSETSKYGNINQEKQERKTYEHINYPMRLCIYDHRPMLSEKLISDSNKKKNTMPGSQWSSWNNPRNYYTFFLQFKFKLFQGNLELPEHNVAKKTARVEFVDHS